MIKQKNAYMVLKAELASPRPWSEEMLDTACRLILDEVFLPGSAPGGKVEFKRTLIISFLFRFYLEVSQILKRMVNGTCHVLAFPGLGTLGIPKGPAEWNRKMTQIRSVWTYWVSIQLSVDEYEFREEPQVEHSVVQDSI